MLDLDRFGSFLDKANSLGLASTRVEETSSKDRQHASKQVVKRPKFLEDGDARVNFAEPEKSYHALFCRTQERAIELSDSFNESIKIARVKAPEIEFLQSYALEIEELHSSEGRLTGHYRSFLGESYLRGAHRAVRKRASTRAEELTGTSNSRRTTVASGSRGATSSGSLRRTAWISRRPPSSKKRTRTRTNGRLLRPPMRKSKFRGRSVFRAN